MTEAEKCVETWREYDAAGLLLEVVGFERDEFGLFVSPVTGRWARIDLWCNPEIATKYRRNHAEMKVNVGARGGGKIVYHITMADKDGVVRDWGEIARDFYTVVVPGLESETVEMWIVG